MFVVHPFPVRVRFDNEQVNAAARSVCAHPANKTVEYTFVVPFAPGVFKRRVRVFVDPNGQCVQATFRCDDKFVAIVNAHNVTEQVAFDGFLSERDDARTIPFVVRRLRTLRDDHGLGVKDMARAMERQRMLIVYLNEAVLPASTNKWYTRLWRKSATAPAAIAPIDPEHEQKLAMDLLRPLGDERYARAVADSGSAGNSGDDEENGSFCVPVDCGTGPRLAIIFLKFTLDLGVE
jgi:Protein of unknown function (DUF1251)